MTKAAGREGSGEGAAQGADERVVEHVRGQRKPADAEGADGDEEAPDQAREPVPDGEGSRSPHQRRARER